MRVKGAITGLTLLVCDASHHTAVHRARANASDRPTQPPWSRADLAAARHEGDPARPRPACPQGPRLAGPL